jgi:nucleoside-diphosphate-sugar epimerase
MKETILIIGASGQIGVELTIALRRMHGCANVIAADVRECPAFLKNEGVFVELDVLDKRKLYAVVKENKVTRIYLLAAVLSAMGEKNPPAAWRLNMDGLLNVLDTAVELSVSRVFWPSSIAVFGESSPKYNCPQQAVREPSTVYGISKSAGEDWCNYYHRVKGLDIRSIRYPGLLSYQSPPGGGTTDYAVDIFVKALKGEKYTCFLEKDTILPMMYMEDAIRAAIELMEAPCGALSVRTSYNLAAVSFSPEEIAAAIQRHIPGFTIYYRPDFRQQIADSWPASINDDSARADWNWEHTFDLPAIVHSMLAGLRIHNQELISCVGPG